LSVSGAKKVLDVGVFTGASSLAAALALPKDGKVMGFDINKEYTDQAMYNSYLNMMKHYCC
jgi:tricin synthase